MIKTLSIVIPAYNKARSIHFILDKINGVVLDHNIKKEIIIVNDWSDEETEEAINNYISSNPKLDIHYYKRQQYGKEHY